MDNTMRAAVVREFGQPLVIEEVDVPRPKQGEVLMKVAASGVCHTDLHAAHGDAVPEHTIARVHVLFFLFSCICLHLFHISLHFLQIPLLL